MMYLSQLLCPARHCLLACVWSDSDSNTAEAEQMLKATSDKLNLNPFCGLCGSRDLHIEHGPTKFKTMEEAMPSLAEAAQANADTKKFPDQQGITYDAQRKQRN